MVNMLRCCSSTEREAKASHNQNIPAAKAVKSDHREVALAGLPLNGGESEGKIH
jgi:hypothetical protein